ncbi:MAG: hypothetical protein M1823_004663 [Watsoniomyces obsoletus]|nr:MAG: hypothetical protein M1823_004663 [Watsoniomyces obsoletus]
MDTNTALADLHIEVDEAEEFIRHPSVTGAGQDINGKSAVRAARRQLDEYIRDLAITQGIDEPVGRPTSAPPSPEDTQEALQGRQKRRRFGSEDPSNDPELPAEPDAPDHHKCVICLEETIPSRTYKAPCSHHYCYACVIQYFTKAVKNESVFPPKCCQQRIPLSDVFGLLGPKMTQQVEEKIVEMETVDKTYCVRRSCLAFIPPSGIRGYAATCSKCGNQTCVLCKSRVHEGDCTGNAELEALFELANTAGWRRCHSCHTMVDLALGCNHIT